MNYFNNLTGGRKIMNMPKLGIVSTSGNDCQSSLKSNRFNVLGLTPYTLCEVTDRLCRNRNRHSFAFYITAIIGNTPTRASCELSQKPERNWLARKVAVLVPLQLILISESHGHDCVTLKSLQSLLRMASVCLKALRNYSGFVTFHNSLKIRASLAVSGFGGFGVVQLSLSYGVLRLGLIKTAVSHAVRALQRKTQNQIVTRNYSTLVTVTRDYLTPSCATFCGSCHE